MPWRSQKIFKCQIHKIKPSSVPVGMNSNKIKDISPIRPKFVFEKLGKNKK